MINDTYKLACTSCYSVDYLNEKIINDSYTERYTLYVYKQFL